MTSQPPNLNRRPQLLDVQWLDAVGPLPVVFFRRRPLRLRIRQAGSCLSRRGICAAPRVPRAPGRPSISGKSPAAFTLLELLMVIAIIGLMASVALPHMRGFTKANNMVVATQQLMSDVQYARQRAIANRSTVYLVFVPPDPWNLTPNMANNRDITNRITGQYRGYALLALRSVGDQPGRSYPTYLTDWRSLPTGVFIPPFQLSSNNILLNTIRVYTTNTFASSPAPQGQFDIRPFGFSPPLVPFPNSLSSQLVSLPCIAFGPDGGLVSANDNDQFIALTSGNVLYPTDNNGAPQEQEAFVSESPKDEWMNNPTLVHIDKVSGRAKLEHNQF